MAIQSDKRYLVKTLSRFNLTEDDIDLVLAEHLGLEEADFSVPMCKNAICKSVSEISSVANISEDGLSFSRNMGALEMWYNALCEELGKENILDGKPKVRNRSNSW